MLVPEDEALGVVKGEEDTDRELAPETLAVFEEQALGVVKGEKDSDRELVPEMQAVTVLD